ncbi:MAG TPA: hypothetical protein VOA80_18110, partial [Thermoanaerobaculia bacterium]|nr:hypothetical protein [Thermoanaerobaculia bacterium]
MIGLNSLTRGAVLGATLLALPGWAQEAPAPASAPASATAPAPAPAAAAGAALHLSRRQAVDEALSHNPGIMAAAQQVE